MMIGEKMELPDFSQLDIRLQLKLHRIRERAMDDEMIRRYIANKEFDMEHRYCPKYRAEWVKKSGMKPSRFNAALDRVINEAWRVIRDREKTKDAETGNTSPAE